MKQNTASQRIAAEIRARIRSGALAPGDHVPSARKITEEWGVALATATKVLAQLRREGLVRAQPGIGTVVRARDRGPELSRDRIVEAAIAIADEEGLAALSMRGVATELAMPTMSLYRHVASKEELLERMTDAVFAESPPPPRGARTWRAELESLGRLQWATYGRHPWLAHTISMTRPQLLPNGMRHTEAVLSALSDLDLDAGATLRAGITFLAYVRGMAASLEADRDAERDTGMSGEEWIASNEPAFSALSARFPTLARLSDATDVDMDLDALFEEGLACFLDGLAVRSRAEPKARR